MLSLVAGPTAIAPWPTATEASDVVVTQPAASLWLDGIGVMVLSDTTSSTHAGETYCLRPDGHAFRHGGARWQWSGFGWRYSDQQPLLAYSHSGAVPFFPVAFPATLPNGSTIADGGAPSFSTQATRQLVFAFGLLYSAAPGAAYATGTAEWNSHNGDSHVGQIQRADATQNLWWLVSRDAGLVYQYDADARAEVAAKRTTFGSAIMSAAYSVKHGMWFVIRHNSGTGKDELSIYTTEPVAASISTPALAHAPVPRGALTNVSATVLGAASEPCAGRNIRFSATSGTFNPSTAVTDSAGKATTAYRAPFATGSGTVTATMDE